MGESFIIEILNVIPLERTSDGWKQFDVRWRAGAYAPIQQYIGTADTEADAVATLMRWQYGNWKQRTCAS